jgi:threonine synthase
MKSSGIFCSKCGFPFPKDGLPYRCPICSGLFDYQGTLYFNKDQIDSSQPGIWRYQHTFGFQPGIPPVSLAEGNTPLIWADVLGRRVAFKCEFLNPSGSFKDRGSTVITTLLASHAVTEAVEDSSGNAGASFAAYAARAGIKVQIFVPQSASGPKRRQIEAYGAELVPIPGSRSDVAYAVEKVAATGAIYASHAYMPFNLSGYATAAYEIVEQLGQMPGAVIVPAGQGGFLLGLSRGFEALRIDDSIHPVPKLIGVQARSCAPLWALFEAGGNIHGPVEEGATIAEGVRVSRPLRSDAVIAAVLASHGCMYAVKENEILPGYSALAHLGFYVEPTSAIVWSALVQMMDHLADPIVVILTGSGLKYG